MLAALIVNMLALAVPLFTMNVYDRVVPNNATETLWALSIGVVLIMCGDVFMRLLRSHFVDEASARVDVKISATLMEKVLGMRLENRPESVGSFASNLRGFEQVRDFIARWLPSLVRSNRSYLTVAVGCTGGQHRSVFLVEQLAASFSPRWITLKRHRELDLG